MGRGRQKKDNTERHKIIIEARTVRGLSLEATGKLFTPPLTRERVRQLQTEVTKKTGLLFKRNVSTRQIACVSCGRLSTYRISLLRKATYMCRPCFRARNPRKTIEQRRERQRAYYRKNKSSRFAHSKKWIEKIKKDPIKWARYRAQQKAARQKWQRKNAKRLYEELKKDPIKYQKHLAASRAHYQRRKKNYQQHVKRKKVQ